MAKPKNNEMAYIYHIQSKLDAETHRWLLRKAKAERLSLSRFIRKMIETQAEASGEAK